MVIPAFAGNLPLTSQLTQRWTPNKSPKENHHAANLGYLSFYLAIFCVNKMRRQFYSGLEKGSAAALAAVARA